ncbi:MAG: NADH-quinone oxidoreductase subunit C [Euryarchaeota archaeon]|nr:NADH-quinone oxidoreductase subunit C [Euryarchaeota archaeon]
MSVETPSPTAPIPKPAASPASPAATAPPKPAASPPKPAIAPPGPAPPPPFPSNHLSDQFEAAFKAAIIERVAQTNKPMYVVDPAQFLRIIRHCHDVFRFEHLACVTGIDMPPSTIEVVYNLYSYEHKVHLAVKLRLPRANPTMDSAVPIWSGANWPEREIYDLLGVTFNGHPDLKRILLPEGWQGHPLRKDYDRSKEQFVNIAPDGDDLVTTDPSKGW